MGNSNVIRIMYPLFPIRTKWGSGREAISCDTKGKDAVQEVCVLAIRAHHMGEGRVYKHDHETWSG